MGATTRIARTFTTWLAETGGGDNDTDVLFGKRIDTGYVFGVLMIKGPGNTIHDQQAIPSTYDSHAEIEMLSYLRRRYPNGLPIPAKLIFYVSKSPCRNCANPDGGISDLLFGIYHQLAAHYPITLSIVFHQYYLKEGASASSNRRLDAAWDTRQEADGAYRLVEQGARAWAQQNGAPDHLLRIRHIDATKA